MSSTGTFPPEAIADDATAVQLAGRRVLVLVDLRLEHQERGARVAAEDLDALVQTVQALRSEGSKCLILPVPFGAQPSGETLLRAGGELAERLGTSVAVPDEALGDGVGKLLAQSVPGAVILAPPMVNAPQDERESRAISNALAKNADVYINDAPRSLHACAPWVTGVAALVEQSGLGPRTRREMRACRSWLEARSGRMLVLAGTDAESELQFANAIVDEVTERDCLVALGDCARLATAESGQTSGDVRQWRRIAARVQARGADVLVPVDGWFEDENAPTRESWWATGDGLAPGSLRRLGPATADAIASAAKDRFSLVIADRFNHDLPAVHFDIVVADNVERAPGGEEPTQIRSSAPHAWRAWLRRQVLPGIASLK